MFVGVYKDGNRVLRGGFIGIGGYKKGYLVKIADI
jgi:hypothetical protein